MTNLLINVRPSNSTDSVWIKNLMEKDWGGEPLLIRGEKFYPTRLNGIIAEQENNRVGFLFYEIRDQDCEIIVFEVFNKFQGIGTQLLEELKKIVKKNHCNRIFLMTTNDNLDALRFYQKKGFSLCKLHVDSVKISRKIKPTIGLIGDYGIPVRDELDLELFI
jgi:ribosomal protein S18 acetylase RimI-like enzyme